MSIFQERLLARVERVNEAYVRAYHAAANARPSQLLLDHLRDVADLTAYFLRTTGLADAGFAAGLLHDLGKYNHAFQKVLAPHSKAKPPYHSIVGARLAKRQSIVCFPIHAHHSGLRDRYDNPKEVGLNCRLSDPHGLALLEASVPARTIPEFEEVISTLDVSGGPARHLAVRLTSSALIDADRSNAAGIGADQPVDWQEHETAALSIIPAMHRDISYQDADQRARMTRLNDVRCQLLEDALLAAEGPRGLYSMTAPLGSGKTIAAIMFAVRHARQHGLARVIIVSPMQALTSEIAVTVRSLLPSARVLEDHSSVLQERHKETLGKDPEEVRIIRHNWAGVDVVVTTSVQFVESLYTHLPSKSRKLHRYTNSVILIDEAHLSLPTRYLSALTRDLRQLVDHCGSTVVMMSATQMDLSPKPKFGFDGLDAKEINGNVEESFRNTIRVTPGIYGDLNAPLNLFDADAATRFAAHLARHPSVLCIVNEVAQAENLHRAMPEGTYLMTSHMCPKHRADVLEEIKRRQKAGQDVRLIATCLVEVGVDIDYPVVYRAASHLASIIQSMGRCNRNWRLPTGHFFIFHTVDRTPDYQVETSKRLSLETLRNMQDYEECRQLTLKTLADMTNLEDLLHPDALKVYTRALFGRTRNYDPHGICELLDRQAYRTASRAVRVIEDQTISVLVPYDDESKAMIRALEAREKLSWAAAQPYLVSLRGSMETEQQKRKLAEKWGVSVVVVDQNSSVVYASVYHPTRGLVRTDDFNTLPVKTDVALCVLSDAGNGG